MTQRTSCSATRHNRGTHVTVSVAHNADRMACLQQQKGAQRAEQRDAVPDHQLLARSAGQRQHVARNETELRVKTHVFNARQQTLCVCIRPKSYCEQTIQISSTRQPPPHSAHSSVPTPYHHTLHHTKTIYTTSPKKSHAYWLFSLATPRRVDAALVRQHQQQQQQKDSVYSHGNEEPSISSQHIVTTSAHPLDSLRPGLSRHIAQGRYSFRHS